MTKYVLTSTDARESINLREYGQIIADAVFDVVEDDEPLVMTSKDYYCVEMDVPMTEIERIQIDDILCASELGKYRVDGQMLFTATEEESSPDSTD